MADEEIHDESGKFAQGNQAHTRRKRSGRKPKLPRFLEQFKCVLEQDHPVGMAIIHSDHDLLFKTNMRLNEEDRVGKATLSRWKSHDFVNEADRELGEQFRDLYEQHLIEQRERLFEAMVAPGEERSWQRWMAIIERKFDDWNLRSKSVDETEGPKQLVFRVDPGGGGDTGDEQGD